MLTKKFANYLLVKRASNNLKSGIINVSSSIAFMASAGAAVYSATKVCMNYFTEGIAFELKDKIDIQCLCPSMTQSNLLSYNAPPGASLFPASRVVYSSLS